MKASRLKTPMKIERPCSSSQPRPAIPPSPPKPSMNSMEHLWETHGRRLSEAGLRRGSDNSVVLTEDTDSFIIGDRVWVGGTKPGQIAYIGETQFAPGDWAGIVLDEPIGKNDGSVAGCRYFQCEPKRGIFSRLTRLTRYPLSTVDCSFAGTKTPTSPQDSKRGSFNKAVSPSLNTSTSSLASVSQRELRIGERVIISSSQGSKTGVLRYLGSTEFAAGEWCGVELDDPNGKNDGSVEGKRYFECRPKYGLFAPVHKVSRSPSSKNKMCVIHRPTGAALNASLKRSGSKESLASISSIGSTATSVTRAPTSTARRSGFRTVTPARSTMQDLIKEKQDEVDTLKKERDLERERFTKAANQADKTEQSLLALKQEYEKCRGDHEKAVQEAQNTIASLLEEKNMLNLQLEEERRKCEDLLFRFEEESINKDDIQKLKSEHNVVNLQNENKIKELEQQLSEERERVIQLEKDSIKLFEVEEELTRLRTEMQMLTNQNKNNLQDIQDQQKNLAESKFLLEKEVSEKNATIQKYVQQINELQESLSKKCEESSSHKELELSFQRSAEETKKLLEEKCALYDIMQKEHEIECENWQKELRHLQENMERLEQQKNEESRNMAQEFQKKIEEKDECIKAEIERLKEESNKSISSHVDGIEKLKAENDGKLKQLTESFETQLKAKADEIETLSAQLQKKLEDCDRLTKELSETQSSHKVKDEHEKETLQQMEELKNKINLFGERCSLLLSEEDAVQCEIEVELRKFYNEYANMNGHQLDPASEAALNLKRDKIELKQLPDIETNQFEVLKENFKSRYISNLKLIKEIIAMIVKKDTRIETLERNVTELKNIAMNKDGEIKIMFDKTTELQGALSLLEETKANLESELKIHESNLEDLKRKLARAEEKIAAYMDEKQKSELNAANAISTSEDLSNQLKRYNEDLRKVEKEMEEARDKEFQMSKALESMKVKCEKAEDELAKSTALIQQMEIDKKQLLQDLETTNKTLVELQNDFKTRESQLISTNEMLNLKVTELNEALQKSNSTIQSLQSENETKSKDLEDAKKQIDKLSSECLDKEQFFEKFNIDVNNLRENLRTKDNEIQNLQAELQKERTQIEAMSTDIKKQNEEFEKIVSEKLKLEENYQNVLKELEILKESVKQKENDITKSIQLTSQETETLHKEISTLQNELKRELEEKENLRKEKFSIDEADKTLQSELNSLNKIVNEKDTLLKDLQNKVQEITTSKDNVLAEMKKSIENNEKEKENLMEKAMQRDKEMTEQIKVVEEVVEKKNSEINELKEKIIHLEKLVTTEREKGVDELKSKNELAETIRSEKERLEQQNISLEKLVKNYEEKMNGLAETVKNKDAESEKNMQNFIEKINALNEQNNKMKESQVLLEKENKQLSTKYNEVLESLKLAQENIKNNSNNGDKILNNTTVPALNQDGHNPDILSQLKKAQEENESSKMQIDFLNSVIADVQRKNEKLQCKIEVLEMGIPANEADDYNRSTIEKKVTPPRMFCDICDQFDLHETEDCHRQEQDFDEQVKVLKVDRVKPAPRPYCENCEEFGHDTLNCNDAETF